MYSKIHDSTWGSLKRKGLSASAKLLFVYLFSCSHHNIIGLYKLPLEYAASDLGEPLAKVKATVAELSRNGLITYDETVEVLLVNGYLEHNTLPNTNAVKAAVSKLKEVPNTALLQDFLTVLERLPNRYETLIQTVKERLGNSTATVAERYGNTVYSIQKQYTEAVTVTEEENGGCGGASPSEQEASPPPTLREEEPPKAVKRKHGQYGWVRLSEAEYTKLCEENGVDLAGKAIEYVDESAQRTGNKNGWKDWNLVVRKAIRDNWGGISGKAARASPPKNSNVFLDMLEEEYGDGSGRNT